VSGFGRAVSFVTPCHCLGHPCGGRFFVKAFFTAAVQSPSIFNTSGFGPGFGLLVFFALRFMIYSR